MSDEGKKDDIKERLAQYKKNKAKYLAAYVERLVIYKKERAKNLGIIKIFERLHDIMFHHSKNKYFNDADFLITDIIELDDDIIQVRLKQHEYTLEFVKDDSIGNLNLYSEYGLTRLLSISMHHENGHWYADDIKAFVDGAWVQDFKDLYERIEIKDKINDEKEKEQRDTGRLNRIKDDFGIE